MQSFSCLDLIFGVRSMANINGLAYVYDDIIHSLGILYSAIDASFRGCPETRLLVMINLIRNPFGLLNS